MKTTIIIAILLIGLISCTKEVTQPTPTQPTPTQPTPTVTATFDKFSPPQVMQGIWVGKYLDTLEMTTNDIIYNNQSFNEIYHYYAVSQRKGKRSYEIQTEKDLLSTLMIGDKEQFTMTLYTIDTLSLIGNAIVRNNNFVRQ